MTKLKGLWVVILCFTFLNLKAQLAKEYLKAGNIYLKNLDYVKAIKEFTKGIKCADANRDKEVLSTLYLGRSVSFLENNNAEAALNDINKAIETRPSQTAYYSTRYLVFVKLKKFKSAMTDVDTILAHKPNNLVALRMKGWTFSKLKEHEAAEKVYKLLITINPGDAYNYSSLAYQYRLEKKYDSAIYFIDSAIKLESSNPSLYSVRATIKGYMKDFDGSEKDNYKSMELKDEYTSRCYTSIAYLTDKGRGDWAKMIEHCNKAIKADPKFAYPVCNRGYAKLMLGQLEEGKQDIITAMKMDPDDSYAYYFLAIYYRLSNKPRKSCPLLDKAILTELDEDIVEMAQSEKKTCGCK